MRLVNESLVPDPMALLQRFLNAVEPAKHKQGFGMACAIVLAMETFLFHLPRVRHS